MKSKLQYLTAMAVIALLASSGGGARARSVRANSTRQGMGGARRPRGPKGPHQEPAQPPRALGHDGGDMASGGTAQVRDTAAGGAQSPTKNIAQSSKTTT